MSLPEAAVSALCPVHAGVEAPHLRVALKSLLTQSRPVDEIVVVEDGPLDPDQHAVLEALDRRHPRVVRVVLPVNQGAGVANQRGLEVARGRWILKADADDISTSTRVEAQLRAVGKSGADVCGSTMVEFIANPLRAVSVRSMPGTHEEIGRRLRWNSPINHPTAFYRREVALTSGGYPPWRNMQDYGLFVRMYAHGARMMNVDEPLVWFRASAEVTARRRSATVRRLEWLVQRELHQWGLVSRPHMALNMVWRSAFRMMPSSAVGVVSRRMLARPALGHERLEPAGHVEGRRQGSPETGAPEPGVQ